MVLSRQQKKDAIKYVLETVFDLQPDSNIHNCFTLNQIESPYDICGLDVTDIADLEYPTATPGVNSKLPAGNIGLLKCFKAFVAYKTAIGDPIGDRWTSISTDEFDSFRCSPMVPPPAPAPAPRHPQPPSRPCT